MVAFTFLLLKSRTSRCTCLLFIQVFERLKMDPDNKIKLGNIQCIICSCAYPSSRRSGRKEVVENKKGVELVKQFCQFLSVPEANLGDNFACSSCQALLQKALNERKENEMVEGKVLKLQMEVLKLKQRVIKEMENLKQGMKSFLEEMQKIEDVLKGKSVNQSSEVDTLRKSILEAIQELQSYQKDIYIQKESREEQQQTLRHLSSDNFQEDTVFKGDTVEVADQGNSSTTPKRVPNSDEEVANVMSIDGDEDEAFDPDPESDSSSDSDISASEESSQPHPDIKPTVSGGSTPKKQKRSQGNKNCSVIEVDSFRGVSFEGMSYLKKYFIYQALKAQPRGSKLTEKEKTDYETKKERGYVNYYDKSTKIISIAGVQLTINEAERTVNCSSCSYSTSGPDHESLVKLPSAMAYRLEFCVCQKLEADIRRHIRQQHLEPLQLKCKLCDSAKVFTSDSSFRTHMRKVHSTLQCDICGKSMKRNAGTLTAHKWLHMNAENTSVASTTQEISDFSV